MVHITQQFPGDLLPSTYPDPEKGVIGISELERRQVYVRILEAQIGHIHLGLVELIKQCLQTDPTLRPSTDELLSTLQGMKGDVEGVYGCPMPLDMARLRLAKEIKMKDKLICELKQQVENLTEQLQKV